MRIPAALALLMLVVPASERADAGELRVSLSGIESGEGEVRVALFKDDEESESERFLDRIKVPAAVGTVEVVFENVPPGVYGINAFHDENGDEKLDRNLVGMPKEAYGFSKNARGRFGPPEFDAYSFEITDAPKALAIELE